MDKGAKREKKERTAEPAPRTSQRQRRKKTTNWKPTVRLIREKGREEKRKRREERDSRE